MTVRDIQSLIIQADPNAKHYYSATDGRNYTRWMEYERLPYGGDDLTDAGWRFQVDRYTKDEYDPIAETIEQVLNENHIAYRYQVEYDQDDGYIRHLFDCEGI
jgi:hypothetical protein